MKKLSLIHFLTPNSDNGLAFVTENQAQAPWVLWKLPVFWPYWSGGQRAKESSGQWVPVGQVQSLQLPSETQVRDVGRARGRNIWIYHTFTGQAKSGEKIREEQLGLSYRDHTA